MESGRGRFRYLRGTEKDMPIEKPQEKFLRLLATQHPPEENLPHQAEFTPLDIFRQIHGDKEISSNS